MHQITTKDFPELDLGDVRRNERFVSIINNINSDPGSSIPLQNESWYSTKATYEFYKNEGVSIDALRKAISSYGSSLISDDQVLIAHDFCQISYNSSAAQDLGYLANTEGRGIITYNSIGISSDGTPLALLYQQSFVRELGDLGKAKKRSKTAFNEKESYNWYEGITSVNKQLGDGIHKIHIADREADIYELFFCAYEHNTDLLIRAMHNRKLKDRSPLWDTIAAQPAAATTFLKIPDRTGKTRSDIEAEVRYRQVEILRPSASKNEYKSVAMTAIELIQISTKQDWQEEIVHWKLLTTLTVTNLEEALQCVKWYCYRWLIERFHYVLKSGTQIEALQLQQVTSLQKATHVYSIAAMRIMQLTYLLRQKPDASCEPILTKEQWVVLYALIHKRPPESDVPITLGDAVKWIGRLGGAFRTQVGRTTWGKNCMEGI